jgi:hypothetical protein
VGGNINQQLCHLQPQGRHATCGYCRLRGTAAWRSRSRRRHRAPDRGPRGHDACFPNPTPPPAFHAAAARGLGPRRRRRPPPPSARGRGRSPRPASATRTTRTGTGWRCAPPRPCRQRDTRSR